MDGTVENRMERFVDYFFGPLKTPNFCTFFLVMTIFGFVFVVASFLMFIYDFTQNVGTLSFWKKLTVFGFYVVFYLQSRILYSMCVGSIK